MRRPYVIAAAVLGTLSVVLICVSVGAFVEKPTVLRVAIASADADDTGLITAASKLAKRGRHLMRLKVVPVSGVEDAAQALDRKQADLAVVRADIAMPDSGETVVLLHKDAALLVAPAGSEIAKIADLSGKRVGVLSGGVDDARLLDTVLAQYDVAPETVTRVPLKPDDVGDAVKAKTVDAVFVVGLVASGVVPTAVKAIAKAGEGPPVFLPVAEAAAVAERQPAYESIEVARGTFGGTPPRPSDDIDTLGVTTSLVASADLSEETVGALTRLLLTERVALAEVAPLARRMTAPSTDRGGALPVHPGAAAYIDDEEETFFDKYSDFIYIGAMVLGVMASGLTAVVGRIGSSGAVPVETFIGRLLVIFRQARCAASVATLDQCEADVDAIVEEALGTSSLRGLDEKRVAALTMAVAQVREAIHERREVLRRAMLTVANDDPRPAFDPILIGRTASERPAGDY